MDSNNVVKYILYHVVKWHVLYMMVIKHEPWGIHKHALKNSTKSMPYVKRNGRGSWYFFYGVEILGIGCALKSTSVHFYDIYVSFSFYK